MKRSLFLFAAAPLLIAAAPAWQQRALESAAPFIDRANEEWSRAIVSGDSQILSAPYDVDGIFIGPDGTEVRGRAAVQAMYSKPHPGAQVLKANIKSDGRAAADPDDVYEWGSAEMTVRLGDKVSQKSGRYLTVWHRSGERWLISHNIAF